MLFLVSVHVADNTSSLITQHAEKFVKLLNIKEELDLQILRIYSSAVERKNFPGAKYHTTQQEPSTKCPDWEEPYALHHMIRKSGRFPKLTELDEKLKRMKKNKKIPSGKLCNEYRQVLRDAEDKFLEENKFDVIFCTCNEASGG